MRGNVAKEPKGICLVSTLLVMLGEGEGTLSTIEGILRAADQQIRLAQTEVEMADPEIRPNQAEGVIGRLGDPDRSFSPGEALGERPQLGQGPAQVDTKKHGGQAR